MSKQVTDTLMMIRPVAFYMNEQTAVNNYYQKAIAGLDPVAIQQKALSEFDGFVEKLRSAEIGVIVFEDTPDPGTPDSIFPNNWISFHESGQVMLYPMFAENRRLERRMDIPEQLGRSFVVKETVAFTGWEAQSKFLEGTGSLVLDRQNKVAYAALSDRTMPEVLDDFAQKTGFSVVSFHANQTVGGVRRPIYHTNVMMCLGEQFAVICLDSIDDEAERKQVTEKLEATGREIIGISEAQKERFAGNMLQVVNTKEEKFVVMSASAYHSLNSSQISRLASHGKLLYHSLDTIECLGGGSARCMMAEVFLPKK